MNNGPDVVAVAENRLLKMWGSTEVTATNHNVKAEIDGASQFDGKHFAESRKMGVKFREST